MRKLRLTVKSLLRVTWLECDRTGLRAQLLGSKSLAVTAALRYLSCVSFPQASQLSREEGVLWGELETDRHVNGVASGIVEMCIKCFWNTDEEVITRR